MKIKLQQLNLTYVRDIDGTEWLFIPSTDKNKEWKTSHNGCFCLSEENYTLPYFNPKSGHVNADIDIEHIRLANDYEIDSFIDVLDYYKYTINENKLEKIK
jgi:hypothetical protein